MIPQDWVAQTLAERPLEVPVAKLNALVGQGDRKQALEFLEKQVLVENKGEVPLTVLAAQLHAAFEQPANAKALFSDLVQRLNDALEEKLVAPRDGAFAFLKLATSISNAGLSPNDVIDLAMKHDSSFFKERLTRDLLHATIRTGQLETASRVMQDAMTRPEIKKAKQWKDWATGLSDLMSEKEFGKAHKALAAAIKGSEEDAAGTRRIEVKDIAE